MAIRGVLGRAGGHVVTSAVEHPAILEVVHALVSEGRIELTATGDGLIQLEVGVGDPDAPAWEEALYAESVSAGAVSVQWDLTDRYASLPPGPADQRWYVRVRTDNLAVVNAFEIDHGDTTYIATDLPTAVPETPSFDFPMLKELG